MRMNCRCFHEYWETRSPAGRGRETWTRGPAEGRSPAFLFCLPGGPPRAGEVSLWPPSQADAFLPWTRGLASFSLCVCKDRPVEVIVFPFTFYVESQLRAKTIGCASYSSPHTWHHLIFLYLIFPLPSSCFYFRSVLAVLLRAIYIRCFKSFVCMKDILDPK